MVVEPGLMPGAASSRSLILASLPSASDFSHRNSQWLCKHILNKEALF